MREPQELIRITEPKQLAVEGRTAEIFFTAFVTEMDLANIQVTKPNNRSDMGDLWGFLSTLRAALSFSQKIDAQDVVYNAESDSYQSLKTAIRSFSDQVGLADMQMQDFGGINQLRSFLKGLRRAEGFPEVTSLGIICDAERFRSPEDAFKSVCDALRSADLTAPMKIEEFAGTRPKVGVLILPDAKTKGMLETLCLRAVADDPVMSCVEEYFDCVEQRVPKTELPKNIDKAKVQTFLASRPDPELQLGRAAQKQYWPWDSPVFEHVRKFLSDL